MSRSGVSCSGTQGYRRTAGQSQFPVEASTGRELLGVFEEDSRLDFCMNFTSRLDDFKILVESSCISMTPLSLPSLPILLLHL